MLKYLLRTNNLEASSLTSRTLGRGLPSLKRSKIVISSQLPLEHILLDSGRNSKCEANCMLHSISNSRAVVLW